MTCFARPRRLGGADPRSSVHLYWLLTLLASCSSPGREPWSDATHHDTDLSEPRILRIATFNIRELSTEKLTFTDLQGRGLDD